VAGVLMSRRASVAEPLAVKFSAEGAAIAGEPAITAKRPAPTVAETAALRRRRERFTDEPPQRWCVDMANSPTTRLWGGDAESLDWGELLLSALRSITLR
jgi:hypothetical protein